MDLSKLSDADLAALQSGDLSKLSDAGLAHLSSAPEKPAQRGSWTDIPNAIGTGVNQGLARLAGLPVDAAANIVDLGKAALGTPFLLAGKVPPEALQVGDRSGVIGSGENLIKNLPAKAMHAQNPEYEGGYLQAAGAALPSVISPASGKEAAIQAGTNVAGSLAGKFVGEQTGNTPAAIVASVVPSVFGAKRIPPTPTPTSATLAAGQAEGYVVPPSQAGAGWLNSRLESIAGKAALNQDSIHRNQQTTNRIAAKSMPGGVPVTQEALADLRAEAGKRGYAPIEQLGDIPITPNYASQIVAMENKLANPSSPVSSLRYPAVSELATELLQPSFTGPDANALIKQLRETGNKGANIPYGGDQSQQVLGKAQIAGARALEDLIDEHLLQFGPSNVVPNLRQARQEIAQSHTLEKALNPATGDINAQVLAQRVKSGKPVSGDQELIGNFAAAFPQLTKPGAGAPTPGVSALEAMAVPLAAMAGHATTGNAPGLLAGGLPLLRSPVRNMLLSKWYQKQFAKEPSTLGPMTPEQMGALSKMLLTTGVLDQPTP